jgi:hypothetical protein
MDGTTGRAEFINNHQCAFPARWQEIQDDRKSFREALERIEAVLSKLSDDHDEHVRKLFEGNGHPAIIPDLKQRLATLEGNIMPRDDVRDVVQAFKVGKAILWTVGMVAAVGFSATLFWHLFKKVG